MRRRAIGFGNERGSALPLAFVLAVILSATLLPLLTIGAMEPAVARNHADAISALSVAEAGIAHAIDLLPTSTINPLPRTLLSSQTFGDGTYTVTISNNTVAGLGLPAEASATTDTDGILLVTSTGTVNGTTRSVEVWTRRGTTSPYQYAVMVDTNMTFSGGGGGTDAYDSSVAAYDAATATSDADIGSNGNITLSGGTIKGDAAAHGTVSDPSLVTGTSTNGAALVTLADVSCPTISYPSAGSFTCGSGCTYNATTGALSVSGGHNVTLSYPTGGTYYFSSINLSGGSTLTMNTGGQHVDMYVSGQLTVSGGGVLNTGAKPTELNIIGCGTNTTDWTLSGGSGAYYGVYAPNHKVTISGGGDIWGSIIGNILVASGGSAVHYDKALARSVWGTDPTYRRQGGTWRER